MKLYGDPLNYENLLHAPGATCDAHLKPTMDASKSEFNSLNVLYDTQMAYISKTTNFVDLFCMN